MDRVRRVFEVMLCLGIAVETRPPKNPILVNFSIKRRLNSCSSSHKTLEEWTLPSSSNSPKFHKSRREGIEIFQKLLLILATIGKIG